MKTFHVFKHAMLYPALLAPYGKTGAGVPLLTARRGGDGVGQGETFIVYGEGQGSRTPLILCPDFFNLRARAIYLTLEVQAP